jgi:hypothetical protein
MRSQWLSPSWSTSAAACLPASLIDTVSGPVRGEAAAAATGALVGAGWATGMLAETAVTIVCGPPMDRTPFIGTSRSTVTPAT